MPDLASMLYQGAEQTNTNVGNQLSQGLSGGFKQGAELALQKQHLDLQTQQMQMEMQKVQDTKVGKYYDYLMSGSAIENPGQRQKHMEFAVGYGNTMGLSPNKDLTKQLGDTENFERLNTLNTMYMDQQQRLMNGEQLKQGEQKLSPAGILDLASDPNKRPQFLQVNRTPLDFTGGKSANLNDEQKFIMQEQTKQKEAQANRDVKVAIAGTKADAGEEKAQKATVSTLAQQQQQALAPYQKKDAETQNMLAARDRVTQQLGTDSSGKSVSSQDVGAMLFPLLHNELGRVNSVELGNQLHLPGIENMTQDQLVKWAGGANPNVIKQIITQVNTAAKNSDAGKKAISDSFEARYDLQGVDDKHKEGLKAAKAPLAKPNYYDPPGANSGSVNFNGKSWSKAALQAYVTAYPNNPDVGAAKAALGVQ